MENNIDKNTGEVYFNPRWKKHYPKRREDKSWCVIVVMEVKTNNPEKLKEEIQEWIDNFWMPRNVLWTRTWTTGKNGSIKRDEYCYYMTEFSDPPKVLSCDNGLFQFQLNGQPTDNYWRDWLIKIFSEWKDKFHEIGEFIGVKNCDDPEEKLFKL